MSAPRPLSASDRIQLRPAATRTLGPDLYVNAGGAAGTVERLSGRGPELWWMLGRGLTIAEAAAELGRATGADTSHVEPHVLEFARSLIEADVAEVAPA